MTYSWQGVWKLRAELYGFLGNCLLDSLEKVNVIALDPKTWADFPLEPANEHMESGLECLRKCTQNLHELPEEDRVQKVMVEYTELFLGPGKPLAPPWESLYRSQDKVNFSWPTFQVRNIMTRNGFEIKSKNKIPEDHIGLELVFLGAVSERFERDLTLADKSLIQEQIDFINEHLLSWIPNLYEDAIKHGSLGYCGGLIELIWGVLLWDKDLLNEYLKSK